MVNKVPAENHQHQDITNKLKVTGLDQPLYRQKVRNYGFEEIVGQYGDYFLKSKAQPVDFKDIFDLYQLDQHCKNIVMISLQLFEQSFKAAMVRTLRGLEKRPEVFQASFQLSNGRIIRRGDLKARLRHLRQHYLEPYDGYSKDHHGQPDPWVLIKEMSFGIATNAFFLLGAGRQRKVLADLYQHPLTLGQFDQVIDRARTFRGRAAHNYRLLGVKDGQHYLYQAVLADLTPLVNPDPAGFAKDQLQKVIDEYCQHHPQDQVFITDNFAPLSN